MHVKSSKPGMQRKHYYQMRLHEIGKTMSVHLDKTLRAQYGKRALPVRKGDEVHIVRGDFKGKKGKVKQVSRMKRAVYVEGILRKKVSGKEVAVPLQVSNLIIISLELTDRLRLEKLGAKTPVSKEGV